jgi:hypothetical protein
MKCVAGHQPNLYPYGGFFAKLAYVDQFVIVDNTQYVKKQYHNRNSIQLQNGNEALLTIPVKNSGHYKQKINEALIDNSQNWEKKHIKTLLRNYKKAVFFDQYFPHFETLLNKEWEYLSNFNIEFIKLCTKLLNINTPIILASENNISGVATNLIFDICQKTNASAYLHGKHSRDYVDFKLLDDKNIENRIQDFNSKTYPQNSSTFMPNLSIIDILFHCGEKSKQIILESQKVSIEK